ncbi:hypothetical protein [Sinomicrobium sp. M5D2P9]
MKNLKFIFVLFLMAAFITSCSVHRVHTNAKGDIPPGQMKKITGEKSAKKYAPGQQKKQQNYR